MSDGKQLIVFSGLKHSGKSTLARLVAQNLKKPLVDLDQSIAVLAAIDYPSLGNPHEYQGFVRRLYREQGKAVFQQFEAKAVADCRQVGRDLLILALGGGTMENQAAMEILGRSGFIIFLDVPFPILFERIMRGGLPAFLDPIDPEGSFKLIFDKRRSLAISQADVVLSLGTKNLDDAFQEVIIPIKEFIHGR